MNENLTISLTQEEATHLINLLYHSWTSKAESRSGASLNCKRELNKSITLSKCIIKKIYDSEELK